MIEELLQEGRAAVRHKYRFMSLTERNLFLMSLSLGMMDANRMLTGTWRPRGGGT